MSLSFLAKTALARIKYSFGVRTPLRVLHRITSRCNLECTFCDHQAHRREKSELSTEALKECMSQFAKLGTITWGITGGEVFLRKDLLEILHHAHGLGFFTSMITNGTIASAEQIAEASRYLEFLVTSVDGSPEGMEKVRGPGVFDKVVRTIENAKRNKLPVIVGTVLTRDLIDMDGIRFMGQFAKEMGVRVSFQNLLLTGPYGGTGFSDAKENIVPHEPDRERLFEALDLILDMRKQGYPFVNNRPWVDFVKNHIQGTLKPSTCYAGMLYCNFFEDGTVRTCQYHPQRVNESSIAESIAKLAGVFDDCPCLAICYVNYNLAFDFNWTMILDGARNAFYRV
ncbi:MAG: radical SAM protein [Nitrospirae bacterium]|nr:radical SAM protein [Magnetococcales bacterium]